MVQRPGRRRGGRAREVGRRADRAGRDRLAELLVDPDVTSASLTLELPTEGRPLLEARLAPRRRTNLIVRLPALLSLRGDEAAVG